MGIDIYATREEADDFDECESSYSSRVAFLMQKKWPFLCMHKKKHLFYSCNCCFAWTSNEPKRNQDDGEWCNFIRVKNAA